MGILITIAIITIVFKTVIGLVSATLQIKENNAKWAKVYKELDKK